MNIDGIGVIANDTDVYLPRWSGAQELCRLCLNISITPPTSIIERKDGIKMNTDEFNTLTEKIYPDKLDREDAEHAIEMTVATEKFMNILMTEEYINAEKNYNDAKKKLREYLRRQNNLPGHFLIPIDKIKRARLRELINFTFGGIK